MTTDIEKIKEHYNKISGLYKSLWSEHIHHGYYETGEETVEQATNKLIEKLLERVTLKAGHTVLDIGCGMGGTCRYLAEHIGCEVTGITISEEQVKVAQETSTSLKNPPVFLVHNAETLNLKSSYDLILSIEMIAHLEKRGQFFNRVAAHLKPGGKWCIAAWVKNETPDNTNSGKYIESIEKGMIVTLPTQQELLAHINRHHFTLNYWEDVSRYVAPTWDITLDIIKNPELWKMARELGTDFIHFLKSFRAMKKGYQKNNLKYVLIILGK